MSKEVCWKMPDALQVDTQMAVFRDRINQQFATSLVSYTDLHTWSIEHLADFWQTLWETSPLTSQTDIDCILEANMPGTHWFRGASLNFAEQLLLFQDEHPAIIFVNESGQQRILSFADLHIAVAQCQAGLKRAGVSVGDRVVGLMPNMPETVIAMLATTSIGAIWSSTSPDFGEQGVLDRFTQIKPKVLFTTDATVYAGKTVATLSKAKALLAQCPDCQCVVIPYHDTQVNVDFATPYNAFIDASATQVEFTPLPFEHPVYILYSSGTTGVPKCITHGAGGTLLQHYKELALHTNISRDDVVFYYTTCGWMMWNWLVSSLLLGATIVLYDGSPMHPAPTILLDLIDEFGISVFGASAKYYSTLANHQVNAIDSHDLASLKTLLSTGSPLYPEQFDYLYQRIKSDVQVASISGGTDLISCFALGCPLKSVKRGELQCIGLGMDVAVFNPQGAAVIGEKGELVCRQPFPSMPLYFWGDVDNQKYQQAYFSRFPGVWTHGDFAEITPEGGVIITGRSDATLNPGGIRIGTAEIYQVVEGFPEIAESLCVGQQQDNDERIVLLLVLQPGFILSQALQDKIKQAIKTQISPHHVPHIMVAVSALPRTVSGKLVELAVKATLNGEKIENIHAIANPEVLAEIASAIKHSK